MFQHFTSHALMLYTFETGFHLVMNLVAACRNLRFVLLHSFVCLRRDETPNLGKALLVRTCGLARVRATERTQLRYTVVKHRFQLLNWRSKQAKACTQARERQERTAPGNMRRTLRWGMSGLTPSDPFSQRRLSRPEL
eukprot:363403-Chlamydomonas_euryale.AAC.10